MFIDYERLIDRLCAAADVMDDDNGGLAAIGMLVTAVKEALGAAGATFTEYERGVGRVLVADGAMEFAVGQPVPPEFIGFNGIDAQPRAFARRTDSLPEKIAEPLRGRGIGSLMGRPVCVRGRVVGAIHVFFVDADTTRWAPAAVPLCAVANAVANAYCDAQAVPVATPSEDDRTLFLALAGHELRTPVTVVKGYASMLADRWDSLDDASRRDAARVLMQRSDELARLVDRILVTSVGDNAAGWLVRNVSFDLVDALVRAVDDLSSDLRRGVRVDVPTELPFASGDPVIVALILSELVTNAVRHSGQATSSALPRLSVQPGLSGQQVDVPAAERVEITAGGDADTVFFRVSDRGIGIRADHVERAFERFWRAQPAGEGSGGVGLGLFLVRRLVERQKGWVSLRPREGGGSVAEVRLLRADGPYRPPVAREA